MASFRHVACACLRVALAVMPAVCVLPAAAQPRHDQLAGRPLSDALRTLQGRGLRLVFSSEIVTPDMRVAVEPRARRPRDVLDELLRPHALAAKEGPGRVLQIVRAERKDRREPRAPARTAGRGMSPPNDVHRELVTVTASGAGSDPAAVSSAQLGGGELQEVAGALAGDALLAVHTLPGVAASDFRSEFSVRGSAYRHVGLVVDGVATGWIRHAAYGRGDTASLGMVSSEGVAHATLQAGAYPRRHGSQLGAELDLTLREGSRTATSVRGAAGTLHATLVGEGPLGRSERGSWLAVVRNSHVDWPIRPAGVTDGTALGFSDAQSKLVYDVSASQQVSLSLLAGRSSVDELDERRALGDGSNHATLASLAWRSTLGARAVLRQRVSLVTHSFSNDTQDGQAAGRGAARQFAYRADLTRGFTRGLFESGVQVQQVRREDDGERTRSLRSAYAHVTWTPTAALTVAPGLRVSHSTYVGRTAIAPWIVTEWSFRGNWAVGASAGRSHQFLDPLSARPDLRAVSPRPEQATHVDVGISHRLTQSVRWQATWFTRRERDVVREPHAADGLALAPAPGPPAGWPSLDGLSGSARGFEFQIRRRSQTGVSGWAAYSFGRTRYTDVARGETFWGDFDQRHAIALAGTYHVSSRTAVSSTFRAGSNFPLPGSFIERDGRLFLGGDTNRVRLPRYARLDVRATRTFHVAGRRTTVFVEVVNALNRANLGVASGRILPETLEAVGFTERLFPRLPSAGIVVEF